MCWRFLQVVATRFHPLRRWRGLPSIRMMRRTRTIFRPHYFRGDTVTFIRKKEYLVYILAKTWILTLWHCVRPLAFASPGCCVEGWRQRSIRVYLLKWSRSFLNNWICKTLLKNQIYLRNDKGVEVQSDCANVIAGLEYNATFFPSFIIINLNFLSLNLKCFE